MASTADGIPFLRWSAVNMITGRMVNDFPAGHMACACNRRNYISVASTDDFT